MELEGARSDFRVSVKVQTPSKPAPCFPPIYNSLFCFGCVYIFALLCFVSLSHTYTVHQDLHQQLDHAESEIKSEQQKRADADEAVANMRDQLEGVRSALSSQVMDLDQQLSGSQEQCSELQRDKVC